MVRAREGGGSLERAAARGEGYARAREWGARRWFRPSPQALIPSTPHTPSPLSSSSSSSFNPPDPPPLSHPPCLPTALSPRTDSRPPPFFFAAAFAGRRRRRRRRGGEGRDGAGGGGWAAGVAAGGSVGGAGGAGEARRADVVQGEVRTISCMRGVAAGPGISYSTLHSDAVSLLFG